MGGGAPWRWQMTMGRKRVVYSVYGNEIWGSFEYIYREREGESGRGGLGGERGEGGEATAEAWVIEAMGALTLAAVVAAIGDRHQ